MILPEEVANEQQVKNEEKGMIISLALEIYPALVAKGKQSYSVTAKAALNAASVFMEEAKNFNV